MRLCTTLAFLALRCEAVAMAGGAGAAARSGAGAASLLRGAASKAAVTPVEKVTELLVDLRSKVQEEGKAEAASYDKYSCFCKEQADGKIYALKKSDVQIANLQAVVEDLTGQIDQLGTDLVALREEIGTEEGEAQTAKELHQDAVAAYHTERQNLTEGVDAITNAVEALRSSRDSLSAVKAAAVFAQLRASSLVSSELDAQQAPKPYQYQSKDVLATLQSLLATFKSKLTELDEQFAADAHSHNMVEGARANTIAALKHSVDQKEKLSAEKTAEKSINEGELSKEAAARAADQAFLDELTAGCTTKAQAWDARSQTRASEITKLTEAMAALEQVSSLYSVNKRLTGLVLKGSRSVKAGGSSASAAQHGNGKRALRSKAAPSFLQLAARQVATIQGNSGERQRLVDFLEQRAQALNSARLAQVAALARLADDPFVKVRALLNDLIAKLEAEAGDEATHKDYCDQEMSSAVEARDQRQAEMESLQTSIEATTAAIKQHETTIAELAAEIAALYKSVLELTALRTEESAENNRTIVDSDEGKVAVDQAISALQSFYGGSQVGFFAQVRRQGYTPPNADRHGNTVSDLAPETFGTESYDGKVAESEGVVGLLQVIAADFERTSTATVAAETAAESAYQEQKGALESSIGDKEGQKGTEETAKGEKDTALVGFKDSLKSETELHGTAIALLETLKASCIDAAETYEQRRQRRQQEIEALKEAHRILEEWQN